MRNARLLAILALGALAVLLAGCPASLSERAGPPPSLERARQLEQSGDTLGAARVYEELAATNSGTDRNDLLLHAAQDYLAARSPDNAARVLGLTQAPLEGDHGTWHALLNTQLALERGQTQEAARQLAAIPEPRPAGLAALYAQ